MSTISNTPTSQAVSVDLWWVALDEIDSEAAAVSLTAYDRVRADRRRGLERARFIARHAALRMIADQRLGIPGAAAQVDASYGRPPRCDGLHLSLSHAGPVALIATSSTGVGVDVESTTSLPDDEVTDVAEFVLDPSEQAVLFSAPPGDRARHLLTSWTRKEAYLKLRGWGIGDVSLADVEMTPPSVPAGIVGHVGHEVADVHVVEVAAPRGYIAALAAVAPIGELRTHRFLQKAPVHVAV